MTLEERYALSCYEELTKLDDKKDVRLVRHNETGVLYVKKCIHLYNRAVYECLMAHPLPHTPKVFLCVEDGDALIVIEEYINGVTLEKKLESDGVFSEAQAADIVMKLCDTLQLLHESTPPIIHRDIKPSNIMFTDDREVKLIDFNAAKEFTPGQAEDTRLMGTRKFAAPEQYGFGQSDARTDIYALGVTMCYLLTKQFPESGQYRGCLQPVIERCIKMEKEQRYPNAEALKQAVADAMSGRPTNHEDGNNPNRREPDPHVYDKEQNRQEPGSHVYDEEQNRQEDIGDVREESFLTKPYYSYKEKLPVGFRSGVLWKMIVAVIGYYFIVRLSCTMVVKNAEGIVLTGYPLVANRIAFFFVLMGTVLFLGNYRGIRYRFPHMKGQKWKHWLLTIVYLLLYYVLIILLLVMLGV